MPTPDLRVNVAGLCLQNPIIAASGTCGYGEELHPFVDLNRLGGVVVKGLSLEPRPGNPAPRLVETTAGMLNSVGLQNIGIEAFLRDKLPRLRDYRTNIIVNFFGDSPDEYAAVAARASEAQGIAALEANISCPNVRHGGMLFSSNAHLTAEVVGKIRQVTRLPLWVKLSPNVTDITEIARAAEAAGADAISLINTVPATAIDIDTASGRRDLAELRKQIVDGDPRRRAGERRDGGARSADGQRMVSVRARVAVDLEAGGRQRENPVLRDAATRIEPLLDGTVPFRVDKRMQVVRVGIYSKQRDGRTVFIHPEVT